MKLKTPNQPGGMDAFIENILQFSRSIETGLVDQMYQIRIANRVVRLMIPNQNIADIILPAFEHILVSLDEVHDARITIWDAQSHNIEFPNLPLVDGQRTKEWAHGTFDGETIVYKEKEMALAYKSSRGQLSLADLSSNQAVFCIPSIQHLHPVDGHPLRTIIQWFLERDGFQIVHAGSVGFSHGGVILTGRSGAGKSTSTVSCLDSDLLLAGDDYVLLSGSDPIRVYSIYNCVNLDAKSVSLIDILGDKDIQPYENRIDKALYYLHRSFPNKFILEFPLKAIVVSQVMGKGITQLAPISRAQALTALAPTSLFQGVVNKREAFPRLSRIVKQIPCYQLSIGQSLDSIPSLLIDLIESASRTSI